MNSLLALRALGPIDAKSIQRDPLLRWIIVLPLVVALAARWLLPLALTYLEDVLPWELRAHYPPLMGYVLTQLAPFLVGAVVGFLLLDQRDDRTLTALQVTPLPLSSYLVYRLATPMLLSMLVTIAALLLSGLAGMGVGSIFLVALASATQAALVALLLAALAQNKVQGFALMKASSVFMLPPLIAYFAPPAWQWPFALLPTYWPARTFWALQAGEAGGWLYLLVGLCYQALFLMLLLRRFDRIMHQ